MEDRVAGGPVRLSVVLPARDEADNLEPLWRRLRTVLESTAWPYEVIVVDDGSRDRTREVLRSIRREEQRVRVLRFDRSRGQSAALCAGFDAAKGDWVLTLDADLQNPPEEIPKLLALVGTADLVYGRRTHRRDRLGRRLASRIGNAVRNLLTGHVVADTGCSLKLMRAEALRAIPRFDGVHRFLPTLFAGYGFRTVEVPVGHAVRRSGRSKYGVFDRATRGLVDCLAVRWLVSRSVDRSRPASEEGER